MPRCDAIVAGRLDAHDLAPVRGWGGTAGGSGSRTLHQDTETPSACGAGGVQLWKLDGSSHHAAYCRTHEFSKRADLGRMDPTLFLSVYLLLYPVLQWGLGGWLLAPATASQDEEQQNGIDNGDSARSTSSATTTVANMSESFRHHVLNDEEQEKYYRKHRKGLSSSDEGMYMTEL